MRNIELETLSHKEKITLLEQLWESIDTKSLKLTQAQKKELDNRLDKHERGEAKYSSWEEVRARLDNRK